MRSIIVLLSLFFSLQLFERDTLTAVSVVLPVEEFHCDLDTINNLQYSAILGEDVISSRGTSPKPFARPSLLEKIKPIKSHLLHKGENQDEKMRRKTCIFAGVN